MSRTAVQSLARDLCSQSEMYQNTSDCATRHQRYGPTWLCLLECPISAVLRVKAMTKASIKEVTLTNGLTRSRRTSTILITVKDIVLVVVLTTGTL